jgi:hypothetical protein
MTIRKQPRPVLRSPQIWTHLRYGPDLRHKAGSTSLAGTGAGGARGRRRSARGSSHSASPAAALARRAEAFSVCQDLHGRRRTPPLGADRVRSLIDQRGDRSGDHTGVDHPHQKWLGRVVTASFSKLAVVILCLGSARADDRRQPGHADARTARQDASCRNVSLQ